MSLSTKHLSFVIALFLALSNILILFKTYSLHHQREFLEEKIKTLEEENASLSSNLLSIKYEALRSEIELKVSRLRELPFLKEPVYREVNRRELHSKLLEEMKKEFPDGLAKTEKVLIKFGFLTPDYHLDQQMVSLYGEQIGAYYDVDEKALFTIQGLPLAKGLQNTLLAHELTHTLQDQHFRINNLMDPSSKNDDQELAHQALIEGDATFVTQLYYMNSINISVFWDLLSYFFVDQKEFKKAPMVLQENMLFPYIHGMNFIHYIYQRKGWNGINACFQKPPSSSEEILHPEKYLADDDPPQKMVFPHFPDSFSSSYFLIEENILGEFNIELLFRKWMKQKSYSQASSGWGGDTYQLWEEKNNHTLVLVWISSWDTSNDAKQFLMAYSELVLKKFPGAVSKINPDSFQFWQAQDVTIFLAQHQGRVLMIEASDFQIIEKIRNSFEEFQDSAYNSSTNGSVS
ncbi:MAG: hypothetical protein HYZ67_02590 [Chlamydiae bacterium]|nr:hypothetical protein [Chlamydiota bacterium]